MKKYLYVFLPSFGRLRALSLSKRLLACRWLERQLGQVPMLFAQLVEGVLDEADVRFALAELVARKQAGEELAGRAAGRSALAYHRGRTAGARGAQRAGRRRRRSGGAVSTSSRPRACREAERLLPPLRARCLCGGKAKPQRRNPFPPGWCLPSCVEFPFRRRRFQVRLFRHISKRS